MNSYCGIIMVVGNRKGRQPHLWIGGKENMREIARRLTVELGPKPAQQLEELEFYFKPDTLRQIIERAIGEFHAQFASDIAGELAKRAMAMGFRFDKDDQ